MNFLKELGIASPFKVFAEGGSGQPINEREWVRCGVMNAHALELLQVQVRYKTPEKKSLIVGALESKEKPNELSNWQRLMLNIIEFHVFSETSEVTDWAKCNEAIEALSFAKQELLGFSLSMVKKQNIEGAVSGMLKLLRQEEVLAAGMSSTICVEFIRFFSQGNLTSDKGTS